MWLFFFFFYILHNGMGEHLEDLHNLVKQYSPNDQYVMKQNHSWVNDPFKVCKICHLDFNSRKIYWCGFRFHIIASFKKPLVWYSTKEDYSYLFEKAIKIPFPATCEAWFSSYTLTKTSYYIIADWMQKHQLEFNCLY